MITYGSAEYKKYANSWELSLQPHVAIKAKRLFPRVKTSAKKIVIANTDEVCRDLLWLMERYPLDLSPYDRGMLEDSAAAFDKKSEDILGLLEGRIAPRDFPLAFPLRHYQASAAECWYRFGGLILADELGLGKTAVAIAGVSRKEMQPSLVVVQAHLQYQWASELRRFSPGIKVHVLKTGRPYNLLVGERPDNVNPEQFPLFTDDVRFPDVIISTYHKLKGWVDALSPIIKSVVFDEGQELRHNTSEKYVAAKRLADSATWRIATTATPVYNYGGEMFNIVDVIRPGALGARDEFVREWCRDGGDKAIVRSPKAFGTYLREMGLLIRRTRAEVGRELPGISRIPIEIEADPKALDAIGDVADLAKIILQRDGDPLKKGQAAREFDWRLRQATGLAKAPYVAEFVKMLLESEEKVILAGWHRNVYDIWQNRLRGYFPVMYTGSESPQQKEASRRAFVEGKARVMIISLRSGAGLDGLQEVCRVGVIGELDWSPEVHEQLGGRIYRDGQDEPVLIYYPIADRGSDPVIADILQLKKGQIVGIRDPNGEVVQSSGVDPNHIKMLAEHFLSQSSSKS